MIQTLEALKSGELIGSKTLKLACGLETFPKEILTLSETLEVLDLSDNRIAKIPHDIVRLKKLKILFFARNHFTEFPAILSKCPNLSMVGFKSSQITTVPEHAFPLKLNWLILTDNKITKLPKSIGNMHLLQKCALSGNRIKILPPEMANCKNLELLRVSANNLEVIPEWLFKLPKLSWIAFGGNPATDKVQLNNNLEAFAWNDFSIKNLIGEGASGFISKALWHSKKTDVAIKVFKGDVTSDGLPEDEMKIAIAAGTHKNLIPILGEIKAHPDAKKALVMELITSNYKNLGNPPSLESCTRDTFSKTQVYNTNALLKIAVSMASVCAQLHFKGINHGDFYAHNILVNKNANSFLGDFGAASPYNINSVLAKNIERVEVRAFGCLLEDLINQTKESDVSLSFYKKWETLIKNCTEPNVTLRPSFSEILSTLKAF